MVTCIQYEFYNVPCYIHIYLLCIMLCRVIQDICNLSVYKYCRQYNTLALLACFVSGIPVPVQYLVFTATTLAL